MFSDLLASVEFSSSVDMPSSVDSSSSVEFPSSVEFSSSEELSEASETFSAVVWLVPVLGSVSTKVCCEYYLAHRMDRRNTSTSRSGRVRVDDTAPSRHDAPSS